ncbi:hypothetical protein [Acaryochloris sp. CCMEE 5410]|uniref:hypothetical protein n=1 Tax=Acaryochloris sp. CCMEE 5410 TaxID=310037 RepID=UPI000494932B|nr:hypothetical protein [Acaryochloris sp. CCMEE 5410]KAI9129437.1 hypothetical protein ON05_035610 [Acaryochloris sp. CCMEE 5410]
MNKRQPLIKRFSQNIKRMPRRIGRFSSRLDAAFWKVIFGDENLPKRKSSHVVATVVVSLALGYGMSRFLGVSLANKYPALEDSSLLASGWGGMLVILLVLVGFNTVTLLLLVDRQHRGDDSATHRIATAIVSWGGEDESRTPAKPDQQS